MMVRFITRQILKTTYIVALSESLWWGEYAWRFATPLEIAVNFLTARMSKAREGIFKCRISSR
jgi:hypothetical protein